MKSNINLWLTMQPYMLPESHRLWTVYCMLLKHLEADSITMPQVTYIIPAMQKYYIILIFFKWI